jgi:hypothetical protein
MMRSCFPEARDRAGRARPETDPWAFDYAYRRGDLFEKRRKLMNAWAAYCTTPVEAATRACSNFSTRYSIRSISIGEPQRDAPVPVVLGLSVGTVC